MPPKGQPFPARRIVILVFLPYLHFVLCPPCLQTLKLLSHQTAMLQRLYSVLKICQRAVGSPQNTPTNIKFASYSAHTTSSQRSCSVHTTFPQRLYSVHDASTVRKQLLQRIHGAHTARTQCSSGDLSV